MNTRTLAATCGRAYRTAQALMRPWEQSTRKVREMKAIWNGAVVAHSQDAVVLEGNHYFPPQSLNREYFSDSHTTTTCPWKGRASYLTLAVDGKSNPDAAWVYHHTSPAAAKIKGYVAFWRGVEVVADESERSGGSLLKRMLGRKTK